MDRQQAFILLLASYPGFEIKERETGPPPRGNGAQPSSGGSKRPRDGKGQPSNGIYFCGLQIGLKHPF